MDKKTIVKTVLLMAAAGVLSSSAFDWKAKPVGQLKADLVAYARGVGETDLADRVEKSSGTAEWMRLPGETVTLGLR